MAYILGVNPIMLSQGGMPASAVFFSTALASGVACIIVFYQKYMSYEEHK